MDSIQPEKWYAVKEVADILRVSVDTIRRLVLNGKLRAVVLSVNSNRRRRVYRSMRILGKDLLDFLRRHAA